MRLNVSTCYAMQIILYLTRNERVVSSSELSEKLTISQRYILQIAGKLRDSGLINAYTGISGGFTLKKAASEISAYDIVKLMEGDMSIPECVRNVPNCGSPCKMTNLLDSLNIMKEYLDIYLKMITFDKLADMNIKGQLSEVIGLVESHIKTMNLQG